MPWIRDDKSGINSAIRREILDAYFDLKNQRLNGETTKIDNSKDVFIFS
ncbi:penicillin-binding protein [Bacillus sp. TH44]|nr:penicillin-binding protein [Bacillus sp. TH44]